MILQVLLLIPIAVDIWPLLPQALIALPIFVPKNQYIKTVNIAAMINRVIREELIFLALTNRLNTSGLHPTLAEPLVSFRLIEYKPNCTKIPAKIAGILALVCKRAVVVPISSPNMKEAVNERRGLILAVINMTDTIPPLLNEPSTLKSEMCNILNVR